MPNIATLWILFGGAFIIATAGKSKELEINGQIRDREVRLIGADGEQKGVVSIQVAMRAAEEAGLDLVKIAPQAVPPVCKVLDYKTDRRKAESDFLRAYRAQLNLYAIAIEKRFAPKKVTYKGIYSFALGKLIEA